MTAKPLAGWHSWRWSGLILIGTDPSGQEWSIGECFAGPSMWEVDLYLPSGQRSLTVEVSVLSDARHLLEREVRRLGGDLPLDPPHPKRNSERPPKTARRRGVHGRAVDWTRPVYALTTATRDLERTCAVCAGPIRSGSAYRKGPRCVVHADCVPDPVSTQEVPRV